MFAKRVLLAGVCALALSACATTSPVPQLASSDVPAAFEQPVADAAPIWPEPDWWRGFGSEELNGLIVSAQSGNLDLAAAETRILQADARVREVGSALLPTVSIGASTDLPTDGGTPTGVSLGASYEFDFWGRNRSLLTAAQASNRATRADRETVALTATAATATAYFQLLSLRERLEIARLNLENAESVLAVTDARVRNGAASPLELAQQRQTIAGQRAQIPQLEQLELETRAALAVLLGRPPEGFDVTARDLTAIEAPGVAPGLPSELLTRRPDVVTAEANLEGANANLAAARAALLPSISLTGSGGVSSGTLTGIATNPLFAASIGLSIAQTIFDAGRREAVTDEARAREQELLLSYRSTVINAFSEVETTLGSIANLNEEVAFREEQAAQSEIAFNIAQARYRSSR
jgi:NodT family efflux transporter outer membrane factor (OMF) lipoprotein